MQNSQKPYNFRTNNTGEEKGLVLGLINLESNMWLTCLSISTFWKWAYQYSQTLMGFIPSRRMIWCLISLGCDRPFGSQKIIENSLISFCNSSRMEVWSGGWFGVKQTANRDGLWCISLLTSFKDADLGKARVIPWSFRFCHYHSKSIFKLRQSQVTVLIFDNHCIPNNISNRWEAKHKK